MNLSDLQEMARNRGFSHVFSASGTLVTCDGKQAKYHADDLTIIDSRSVDAGTDPGDDATLYMIEANDGTKGVMIIPNSFHADPQEARLIDVLRKNRQENAS